MNDTKTARIAELNDQFRKTGHGGRILITKGIMNLPSYQMLQVIPAVRNFEAFTPDNDPHGEHDFGAVTVQGKKVFWKIDYYAPDMMHGSDNAADPKQTRRVLTIMLAEEY